MTGFFLWLMQKVFPNAFSTKAQIKKARYSRQLEALEMLLSELLKETVFCSNADNSKGDLVVLVRTEVEIIARLTIHAKGILRRTTYIRVHTDRVAMTAWFQLAFLGMRVVVVPFSETLLLTYQEPRER